MHNHLLYRCSEEYALFQKDDIEPLLTENPKGTKHINLLSTASSPAPCFGKIDIHVSHNESLSEWAINAVGEIPGLGLGQSSDLRVARGYRKSIFYGSGYHEQNCFRVGDITLLEPLRGKGVGSWLIDQSRRISRGILGPDPWIMGELTPVDKENVKRDPFWRRHVDCEFQTSESGEGEFLGPWIPGFNHYHANFVAVLVRGTGQLPEMTDLRGVLYEEEGRLAFKLVREEERLKERVRKKTLW